MKPANDGGRPMVHPDEADLIAYLDGEMAPIEREQARQHVESCWQCRSRLNAFQASIDNFLRARASIQPGELPPSETALAQFRERLIRHRAATTSERMLFRLKFLSLRASRLSALPDFVFESWRYRKPALAATIAVIALLAAMLDPFSWRAVSAEELLDRAAARELRVETRADKVARSSIRIDRINRASGSEKHIGRVDLARDNQSRAVYLSAQPAAGQERGQSLPDRDKLSEAIPFTSEFPETLWRYFRAQNWFPDVSIAGYRRLIAGRGSSEASVEKRSALYDVRHAFAAAHVSGVTETMLSLDAGNYSPRSISIFTTEDGEPFEYRLTRLSLDFAPRSPELAKLFEPPETAAPEHIAPIGGPAPEAGAAPTPGATAVAASPLNYFNSRASDAEVAVAEALRRVDADLGEEINVFPMTDGSVLVQGLVDHVNRKKAIIRALASLSLPAQVEIYTPAEIRAGAELHAAPDRAPGRSPVNATGDAPAINLGDLGGGQAPLYEKLHAHFAKRMKAGEQGATPEEIQRRIAAFANDAVNLSRQAVFHSWALRKLSVQFSPERSKPLSAEARARVEEIRSDHRRAIAAIARRLADRLTEIAPDGVSATREASPALDSETLFRLVAEQDELVRRLFTANARMAQSEHDLARLLAVLKQLQD